MVRRGAPLLLSLLAALLENMCLLSYSFELWGFRSSGSQRGRNIGIREHKTVPFNYKDQLKPDHFGFLVLRNQESRRGFTMLERIIDPNHQVELLLHNGSGRNMFQQRKSTWVPLCNLSTTFIVIRKKNAAVMIQKSALYRAQIFQ